MKKLKFLFLLIFTLSLLLSLCQNAFALDDPDIKAKSVILAEVNSGKIMYEKNADVQVDPASITKLTTVLLAVEEYEKGNISLDEKITVSETANFDITEDSSTQNIKAGEEMSFKDVLYCALVASANEACNILAERVSGSVDAFVKAMNTRVKQLGCTGTNYVNTHGLTAEGHKTTARDVYLILNEAIKHPLMRQIMETRTYIVQATNTSERRSLENTNMLINPSSEYYYENCKGGKTGTTTAAGFCLASYAADDNMTLISVVMGAESVQLDTGYMQMQNFSETKRLFQWGFGNFSYRTILTTGDLITKVDVAMGSGADSVNLVPEKSITALIPNDMDVTQFKRDVVIYSQESGETLTAPISEGDELGHMSISLNGDNYGSVKLVANTSIDLMKRAYIKAQIKETLNIPIVKIIIILLVVGFIAYFVLVIRYNIISAKRKKAKRAKMRAMRQARQQDELEQMRQGVRVPTRDEEEAAASATGKLRQNREESNPPITFEDFYNRTK